MSYIKFENIHKSFGKNEVLNGIDLEIEKGQLVTLLGPSGCGKSTLLRCLAGLETVSSGRIYLDGKDITDLDPKERNIGMVFQQYSLFPNMTVAQNVAFGLKMKKMDNQEIEKKVSHILDIVDLSDKKNQYPAALSGGQQQRAALARAIVTEPKVLLLDEPLSAIDALLRRSLQVEIRRIQKEMDITAIFVTHDQEEAMVMSDMIHLLYEGRIEQSACPTEMYANPATRFVASFIGHYNLMSTEDFERISGAAIATTKNTSGSIAFRPELVKICDAASCSSPQAASDTPAGAENISENDAVYKLHGKISVSLSHGNILRYAIQCDDIQVDADVLFTDNLNLLPNGSECTLEVRKADCILL